MGIPIQIIYKPLCSYSAERDSEEIPVTIPNLIWIVEEVTCGCQSHQSRVCSLPCEPSC